MDNNYVRGLVDSDSYNLHVTGDGSGRQTSSISIGGDADAFGIKLTKDSSNNVFIDHRGDTLAFRHEDESSGTITSLMELVNDSSLTDAITYGLSVSGRVKASAYHVGSIDTRLPTETGVYMGMGDDNIGYFNVNKGSGVGGFTFSTYSENGTLLQTHLNLLESGDIQAPYYKSTENEHDIEDVAYMGIDSEGNLVRHYMANARMRGMEGRISMVENNLDNGVSEKVNEIVTRINDLSFLSEDILPMVYSTQVIATPNHASYSLTRDSLITSFIPVSASSGSGTYTYSISPSVPNGLSFDTTNGMISGTPSLSLSVTTYTVTVNDGNTTSAANFSLTIVNPPFVVTRNQSSYSLTTGLLHPITSFSPVTASGGSGTYTYSISPSVPSGLSFNTSNGYISGKPLSVISTTTYTVTVNDGNATSTASFSLTITSVSFPSVITTRNQASYSFSIGTLITSFTPVIASSGSGSYTYSISPSLPSGLTFNTTNGLITGGILSSVLSATTFSVTVEDGYTTSTTTFLMTVINNSPYPAVIAKSTQSSRPTDTTSYYRLVSGMAIPSNSFIPVIASSGSGTYTYSISPALPNTISFNTNTGEITGTPVITSSSFINDYIITVSDGYTIGQVPINLYIASTINNLSTLYAAHGYYYVSLYVGLNRSIIPVYGLGGSGMYTFSISGTPNITSKGLSYNTANGEISGSPTSTMPTETIYTVTVTDKYTNLSSQITINLKILASIPPLQISTFDAIFGTTTQADQAEHTIFIISGGTNSYSYNITGTPDLSTLGILFNFYGGTTGSLHASTITTELPLTAYTVTVTDNTTNNTITGTFRVKINTPLSVTRNQPSYTFNEGDIINFTPVTVSGGSGTFTYSITGDINFTTSGLELNTSTGIISGTPIISFSQKNFTITVTDTVTTNTRNITFSLSVQAELNVTTNQTSYIFSTHSSFQEFITVTGGYGTYSFSISPNLPSNLYLDPDSGRFYSDGVLTVSPLPLNEYTITVTDLISNQQVTTVISIRIVPDISATLNSNIPSPYTYIIGTYMNFNPITVTGGTGVIYVQFAYGTEFDVNELEVIPEDGTIRGQPTNVPGLYNFVLSVTDLVANDNINILLTVPVNVVNEMVSSTSINSPYIFTKEIAVDDFTPVTTTGGLLPYTYSIVGTNQLPLGLTLNSSTGQITGTPHVITNTLEYTVLVADSSTLSTTSTFTLTINYPPLVATTNPSYAALTFVKDTAITSVTPVTATGGSLAYTYSISGTPALSTTGLTFNTETGAITGTPTSVMLTQTTYTVHVQDTNDVSLSNTSTFTLTINYPPLVATTNPSYAALTFVKDTAITSVTPVTATGGSLAYTYSISGTPALSTTGLTFNTETGAITGTPTSVVLTQTTYTVHVQDTNDVSLSNTSTFTLKINYPPLVATLNQSLYDTNNRTSINITPITVSGGKNTSYTYSIVGTDLPSGLTFNSTTGVITGTSTSASNRLYTIRVTDTISTIDNYFTINIVNIPSVSANVSQYLYTFGVSTSVNFIPVSGTSGNGTYTYSISPFPLVTNTLTFNTTTGAITGTTGSSSNNTDYTIIVSDGYTSYSVIITLAIVSISSSPGEWIQIKMPYPISISSYNVEQQLSTVVGRTTSYIYSNSNLSQSSRIATSYYLLGSMNATSWDIINYQTNVTQSTYNNIVSINSTPLYLYFRIVFITMPSIQHYYIATSGVTYTLIETLALSSIGFKDHLNNLYPPRILSSNSDTVTGQSYGNGTYVVSTSFANVFKTYNSASYSGAYLTTFYFVFGTTDSNRITTYKSDMYNDSGQQISGASTNINTITSLLAVPISHTYLLYRVNAPFNFIPVVGLSNSNVSFTYSISPSLPSGMDMSSATGEITGTPTTTISYTLYNVTISDGANSDTASFSLEIKENQIVNTTLIRSNYAFTTTDLINITPVIPSDGTGTYTYSITGSNVLPNGLSLNSLTGAITGTVSSVSTNTYTIKVQDTYSYSTQSFVITIYTAITSSLSQSTYAYLTTDSINITPVTGSLGSGLYTYSISPSLPIGLTFNTSTGAITNTSTFTTSSATYTVTVSDVNVTSTSSKSFALNTYAPISTALVQSTYSYILTDTLNFKPITVTGGTGAYTYSIVGTQLPSGLSINTSTGYITNTGIFTVSTNTYTIRVQDVNITSTSTKSFTLTINYPPVDSVLSNASYTYTIEDATINITPVTGLSGSGVYTYSILPAIPTGLSFNVNTGAITNTGIFIASTNTYTVTVHDVNNTSSTSSKSFVLSILAILVNAVNSTYNISLYNDITYTTVSKSGGYGTITYGIYPSLPTMLSFNTSTAVITGTLTSPYYFNPSGYTITATDQNNNTSSTQLFLNNAIYGEWLQIQLPNTINLSSFTIYSRYLYNDRYSKVNNPYSQVLEYVLLGSINNIKWDYLYKSNDVFTIYVNLTSTINYIDTLYSYFRLVVTKSAHLRNINIYDPLPNGSVPINITHLTFIDNNSNIFPPAPLTSNSTTINGNIYNTSSSSNGLYNTSNYQAFNDSSISNYYINNANYSIYSITPYNYGLNTNLYKYTGSLYTIINPLTLNGEWLQIQFPNPITTSAIIIKFKINTNTSFYGALFYSNNYSIVGSNDGISWYYLTQYKYTATSVTTTMTSLSAVTATYQFFRIIFHSIANPSSFSQTSLNSYNLGISNISFYDASNNLYPPTLLTNNTTNVVGQSYGNGTYTTSSSYTSVKTVTAGVVTQSTTSVYNIFGPDYSSSGNRLLILPITDYNLSLTTYNGITASYAFN